MTTIQLTEQERAQLEFLSQHPDPLIARRAKILLDSEKGITAREIAGRLGISRSRVHFWRGRFNHSQMGIFPGTVQEEPRLDISVLPEKTRLPPPILPRQEIGLLPTDTMAEAGIKVWSFFFAEMLSNEAGTIAGEDIEALHDMRVATRRLRAAWELFGIYFKPAIMKKYKKGLQRIGRALGKVRDWDVFIDKAQHDILNLSEEDQQNLQSVMARWGQERQACRQEMIEILNGDEYHQFNEKFHKFLSNPEKGILKSHQDFFDGQPLPPVVHIPELAPEIIYTRLGVVRAYDPIIERATITQLHALRIDVKRLHYSLNFFSEVLGSEAKSALKLVKELQDVLGDLHDAEVACILLGQLLHDWESYQAGVNLLERENPGAVLNYLTYKHQERYERLVAVPDGWKKFNSPELRKSLAAAISAL